MPARVADMHRMLTGKLRGLVEEGSKHTKYLIVHDGELIAKTVLSRSYSEIDDKLLARIARHQLGVNTHFIYGLIQCPKSYGDYIREQHIPG